MGYMGLESYVESDNAADFHYLVQKYLLDITKTVDVFATEVKYVANCYNTPGPVNIALVVESGVLDKLPDIHKKKLHASISEALAKLDIMITENKDDTDQNIVWHVTAYKRMANSLSKWLKENK
jgi:hypothetical protein